MERVAAGPGQEEPPGQAAARARTSMAAAGDQRARSPPDGLPAVRSAAVAPVYPARSVARHQEVRRPARPAKAASPSGSVATKGRRAEPDKDRWGRKDPGPGQYRHTALGCPAAATSPAAAHTNTANREPLPARGDPACLRAPAVPAVALRWANRLPLGSGYRKAGNPALRQKFSGSIPRFLNAASTHGCRI